MGWLPPLADFRPTGPHQLSDNCGPNKKMLRKKSFCDSRNAWTWRNQKPKTTARGYHTRAIIHCDRARAQNSQRKKKDLYQIRAKNTPVEIFVEILGGPNMHGVIHHTPRDVYTIYTDIPATMTDVAHTLIAYTRIFRALYPNLSFKGYPCPKDRILMFLPHIEQPLLITQRHTTVLQPTVPRPLNYQPYAFTWT